MRITARRITAATAALALAAALTGCGTATTDKDAAGVVADLVAQGLPATTTVTYDAKTDPNKMLGRPNGYTSKAAFADQRIDAVKVGGKLGDARLGGSVEVFPDESTAQARAEYVRNISKGLPMLGEYTYLAGNVVVRVSKELAPEEAAAYESALGEIVR